ncbi:MAG: prepilin peptidase [Proteobacteria bacterium]|nr:prepilin peptidase [Pseudomonadota bacterium]
MTKKKKVEKKIDRSNLFEFESRTLEDEELDNGALKPNRLNIATIGFFVLFEAVLFVANYMQEYTLAQFGFLSVFALFLARQTAIDFAYHVLLDIYTFPMMLLSIIVPSMLLDHGTVQGSLAGAVGFFVGMLALSWICTKIMKKPAGFGGGDIKFVFVMGGFLSGFLINVSILLSCIISFILCLFYEDKKNIPFGPGLILSFWICLVFSEPILDLLYNLLG